MKYSVSNIANEHLQGLVRLWHEIRGTRKVPLKNEMTPERLLPWLGNLSIVERNETEGYRLRLVGVNLAVTFGRDLTGRSLNEILPADHRDQINAIYDLAMTANAPIYQQGTFTELPERQRTFHQLLLPISADGKHTTHLLIANYFERDDRFEINLDTVWAAVAAANPIQIKF